MQEKDFAISVVLPVYNEAACIEATLRELYGVLQAGPWTFEVLAVDDGSTDETGQILSRLACAYPSLRVVRLTPNSGQSAAFGVGFRLSRHGIIVTLDADGQNDPADVPRLLAGMDGADLCCGYRQRRQDTWSKRIGSRIGNGVRNAALGEAIVDTGCSLKAFRADYVRHLTMWEGLHRFLPSLCLMQGARVRQIPVNHRPRTRGTSKYTNWGRLKKTVWDLFAVRWMKRRFKRFTYVEEAS